MAQIKLRGTPINTNSDLPKVGSKAPDFHLTAADLSDITLATYKGKKKLLNIVPSLDTPTCALSTKKFNEHAARYGNAVMLIVSADLPFAQKRFCTAEHTDRVVTVSMMRDKNFAKDYGVLIQDGPLKGHYRARGGGAGRERRRQARRTGAGDRTGAELRCRAGGVEVRG